MLEEMTCPECEGLCYVECGCCGADAGCDWCDGTGTIDKEDEDDD